MRPRPILRRQIEAVPSGLDYLHPVLARVFAARGIYSAGDLDYGLAGLHPFHELAGLEQALALLEQAMAKRWRILVIGDFDADGATSTAVAVRSLRGFGAGSVDFLVPDRFRFGYGLSPGIVEVARERSPDLILTVDNGISSHAGIAAAHQAGIRVLVTDHHLPGERMPDADAVVNPNRPDCRFPWKSTAGVGVVFYLMLALRARLREVGWFLEREEFNLARLLDLVALGTVADLVPLERNNRILVAQGVARIRAGHSCPGIEALLRAGGRDPAEATTADLAFAAAPRINAAGRLEDMRLGIRCLLADDQAEAVRLAAELDQLNRERRTIEADMQGQALDALDSLLPATDDYPPAVCLYDPDWHEGVIGLLASRIKERIHRPVVVFTDGTQGEAKGSARSIPGLHVRDAIEAVASCHPGLISRFGGHAMAAGLTLPREAIGRFEAAFCAEAARRLNPEDLEGVLLSDGELEPAQLSLELAEMIRDASPWGQGFPEPLFDGAFEVVGRRTVGNGHLKLTLHHGGSTLDAIAFGAGDVAVGPGDRIRVAYRLEVNRFRGRALQLRIEQIEPVACGEAKNPGLECPSISQGKNQAAYRGG